MVKKKKSKDTVGSSGISLDLSEWNKYHEALEKKFIDPSSEIKDTQIAINSDIQDHFNKETGPGGAKWKKSKRAIRDSGKTLTDTGAMRRQIKSRVQTNKNGIRIEFFSDGESKKYSWVHNTGARIRNRSGRLTKMPKRQFAWVSKECKDRIADAWLKGL